MREPTHECAPHHADNFGGWTNCTICFATIHVDGPADGQCQVIVPWTGRCELTFGHTGRHSVNGILFNF